MLLQLVLLARISSSMIPRPCRQQFKTIFDPSAISGLCAATSTFRLDLLYILCCCRQHTFSVCAWPTPDLGIIQVMHCRTKFFVLVRKMEPWIFHVLEQLQIPFFLADLHRRKDFFFWSNIKIMSLFLCLVKNKALENRQFPVEHVFLDFAPRVMTFLLPGKGTPG